MFDRIGSLLLYFSAIAAGATALVMLLSDYITWLQTNRWSTLSVLQAGYDSGVLKARWFLNQQWSWPLHDLLAEIPLHVLLLLVAPLFWWLGVKLARR